MRNYGKLWLGIGLVAVLLFGGLATALATGSGTTGSLSVAVMRAPGPAWRRMVAVYDGTGLLAGSQWATAAAPTPVFTGLAPGFYTVTACANGILTAPAKLPSQNVMYRNYPLVAPGIVAGQTYSLTGVLAPN